MTDGLLITFEGGEGCGKTTQIATLEERLRAGGRSVLRLREPGGTPLGDSIRELLLKPDGPRMCHAAEALLFAASRAQIVHAVIAPALRRGEVVICDRFIDSSLVYQGVARGLGVDAVLDANRMALQGLWPHLTVLLDLDVGEGLARAGKRAVLDRIESAGLEFHREVREGFLVMSLRFPDRVRVIDATPPPDEVAAAVWNAVAPLLGEG